MNVLFTNLCNRNCPYCFAKPKLSTSGATEDFISLENLMTLIRFLKKSKSDSLGVLGGEPTLHPRFGKFMKILISQGFSLSIFSNGIINKDVVDFLKDRVGGNWIMTVNIHHPDSYARSEKLLLMRCLRVLHKRIALGFNIYKLNFNADFMIGLIDRYNLKRRIRLGIANPIVGEDNLHIPFKLHKKLADRIVSFAQKCDKSDIAIEFDCGFTLCSFSESQIGKLFYCNAIFNSHCSGGIDMGPNLDIWRCFSTSNIWRKRLSDFKNLSEVQRFYFRKISSFRKVGTTYECLKCKYLLRSQCSGGCLAHTLKQFGKNVEEKLN